MSLQAAKSDWETTGTQNLIRYVPSGTFFARFKIGRKLIRKSLNTQTLSTAKLRLRDMIHEYRARIEAGAALKSGKLTVGQAIQIYLDGVDANVSLKPKSKAYRRLLCGFILRTWPGLKEADIRKVTERDCQKWAAAFQKMYASTVVNNSIGTLRAIFQEAVDAGARFENPARDLKKVKVRKKQLQLPSKEEFEKFLEVIETSGAGQAKDCANLVRFLAFSGMRIGEAAHVTWRDVSFSRNEIIVRGDPETGTKNSELRSVPLIPQLSSMLEAMRAVRADERETTPIMRVKECQNSMTRAARLVGMARITHHDLRHLFATVCIEAGCDIPTVSRWLGHKDGGALCMSTYGHLRQQHSQAQAQRVAF
jgi:integrase